MLISCPECNHEISDTAETCPNCGFHLKQNSDVCQYCKGTGKNPKKYKGILDPHFPQIRVGFAIILGIICLLIIICIVKDKPFRDLALPVSLMVLIFTFFRNNITKNCPVCNGTGKATPLEND